MTHRNLVVIDGKEVEIKDLPPEEQERLRMFWSRRAAAAVGYVEVKKEE